MAKRKKTLSQLMKVSIKGLDSSKRLALFAKSLIVEHLVRIVFIALAIVSAINLLTTERHIAISEIQELRDVLRN